MSAIQHCRIHGEWVEDGTTDDCPECIADRKVVALRPASEGGTAQELTAQRPSDDHSRRVSLEGEEEAAQTEVMAQRIAGQGLLLAHLQGGRINNAFITEIPEMGGQVLAFEMTTGATIYLQVGAVRVEVKE